MQGGVLRDLSASPRVGGVTKAEKVNHLANKRWRAINHPRISTRTEVIVVGYVHLVRYLLLCRELSGSVCIARLGTEPAVALFREKSHGWLRRQMKLRTLEVQQYCSKRGGCRRPCRAVLTFNWYYYLWWQKYHILSLLILYGVHIFLLVEKSTEFPPIN